MKQLKKLIVIVRHGKRMMKKFLPDDVQEQQQPYYLNTKGLQKYQQINNENDIAFLTQQGFDDAILQGKSIQMKYKDFLQQLSDQNQIYLRSTDYQRSFYTLQAFYYGLFGKYNQQTIIQKSKEIDELYSYAHKQLNKTYARSILDKVCDKQKISSYNNQLNVVNWNLDDIYDNIAQKMHMCVQLPQLQQQIYQEVYPMWRNYWNNFYYIFESQQQKTLILKHLVGQTITLFTELLSCSQNLVFLSGHDSTLSALYSCFFDKKINQSISTNEHQEIYLNHPQYCDYMVIEVYDNDQINYYVKLQNYNGYLENQDNSTIQQIQKNLEKYQLADIKTRNELASQTVEQLLQQLQTQ